MTLLLDTHAWIWHIAAPQKMSRAALRALQKHADNLFLSPISVWETLLLAQKNRLRLPTTPERWVEEALKRSPLRMAPLTHDIAIRSRLLADNAPDDPADRFIIATALVENHVLLSADKRIADSRVVKVIW